MDHGNVDDEFHLTSPDGSIAAILLSKQTRSKSNELWDNNMADFMTGRSLMPEVLHYIDTVQRIQ